MKKIESIDAHIQTILPKLNIDAQDWNKKEKEAIAEAYFEITKVSTDTSKGRNLDLGCSSCVQGAVAIIKNYLSAVFRADNREMLKADEDLLGLEPTEKEKMDAQDIPSNRQWRKNVTSIIEAARELEYIIPVEAKTKKQMIDAVENHIKELLNS